MLHFRDGSDIKNWKKKKVQKDTTAYVNTILALALKQLRKAMAEVCQYTQEAGQPIVRTDSAS
jgi:hypothetical protein